MSERGNCIECGHEATQRCANCRRVFYCGRSCQKQHWKRGHKTHCRPYVIQSDTTLGRHLVACKDIAAGDVILREEPLVLGPKQITEPVCLACYKRVCGNYKCSKCTWPLCGPQCEASPHHLPECVVGQEIGSPIDILSYRETNHFYEVVTTLRAMTLKKRSPKKYAELMALESHIEERRDTPEFDLNQNRVVNMLKNYFMIRDFSPEEIDASDENIHKILGIIDINAVDIPLEESEINAVYPSYSLLEHSCMANTKYTINSARQLELKAAISIKEGEHLSTNYTHTLWGTAARRDTLNNSKYFMCTCRRCADPTELGTNFSTLRCQKCSTGFLMSAAPLDQLADWICTQCNATITGAEASDVTLKLGEQVEQVLQDGNLSEIENLVSIYSSKLVHPNHFHLFILKHTLLQMLGRDSPELTEDVVKRKEKLCQEFLKTCTALDPGMSRLATYAGVALYEYHLAVLSRSRRGADGQSVDAAAQQRDLDTAKALLQQCAKVLGEVPDSCPEAQLREMAAQNLQEMCRWEAQGA